MRGALLLLVGLFNFMLIMYIYLWFTRLARLKTTRLWSNINKVKIIILLLVAFLWVVSIVIILRPHLGVEQTLQGELTANVAYLFVVDNSASMAARDLAGQSRIKFVKGVTRRLLVNYPAYSSLILFTEMPKLMVPFTFDDSTVLSFVEALEPEYPTYAKGTDLTGALKFAAKYLAVASKKLHKEIRPIVFLFSDGECVKAKCEMVRLNPRTYEQFIIIGVGTREGANIEFQVGDGASGEKFLLRDPASAKPVVTRLNEGFLRELAAKNKDAKYFYWQNTDNVIAEVSTIYKAKAKKAIKNKLVVKRELYPFLVVLFTIFFILFIFDILIYEFFYKIKI